MTAPYIRRPWRSQPQGMEILDPDSILYAGLESVYLGSLTAGNPGGATTPIPNLAGKNLFAGNGTPQATPTAYGVGLTTGAALNYNIPANTTTPWTLAAIIQPVAAVAASTDFIGIAVSGGSATHDRSISSAPISGQWAGYLYDGLPEYILSTTTPAVGRADVIIVWASGSVLGINVNGIEFAQVVANSGASYSGSLFISGD